MFLSYQLKAYYPDLSDRRLATAMALVHQRFSTNTFPSWKLAHPYRMVAHNGEINTLRGNVNWMAARQASVSSPLFGSDITKLWPISYEGQSDTACFDNALEFLVMGGYSLSHAAMMLIPEAWAGNPLMDSKRRAFYEYHACLMEPWDGPAAMAFTDGRQIGATLDRNGLRPARYLVTKDDRVIMSSEAGVLPVEERNIARKWRLQPGKMLLIDLEEGRIISDDDLKADLASRYPYEQWLKRTQVQVGDLPLPRKIARKKTNVALLDLQQAFGYTQESLKFLMTPMAHTGQEAVGSMGNDTPVSVLSNKPKLLHTYFKQNFAQVTNPPIDSIREELVMSLVSFIGPRPNLLDLEGTAKIKRLEVYQPIVTNEDLERIRQIGLVKDNQFSSITIDITYSADKGAAGMSAALDVVCAEAEEAVRSKEYNIVILSDRATGPDRIPIPSLLATSAVHHHLIKQGLRTSVGLVVETGEAHEVHQFAVLAGYGAEAINPYLAFETLEQLLPELDEKLTLKEAQKRYIKAVDKGLLKVMSKMGISTYQSYCGAQIFDAVGLKTSFVRKYFTGTHTQVEGAGLRQIARETAERHRQAFGHVPVLENALDVGGEYAYRIRGEAHMWRPTVVADLQHAVRGNLPDKYRSYAQQINDQSEQLMTLRGLFRLKGAEEMGRKPVPLEEVEPAANIVKRFSTGAMSFGSISREAHTTLAIAMNRIGGKSNTGEGGEEADRFKPLPNGNSMRSAIKQVASGRFGVTAEYLTNSNMMQIKMAQGAKPGEGGQLPGHKVDNIIAKVRHSTPGVGLISPPPHHDIYSIEDLAQLIFDLKNVNPRADVSVKLVSEVGVGTVAAGVAKARSDHVTIAGFEGGTGASPLTSIKHAGSPWEIGLAETHQTLVANRLRGRIAVQVDGGVRTGRDVVIGALLGADEFGFSTAPLIALGCIMMRKCHLNTCPVGVATQDPVLRAKFKGQPEHAINYFFFVAEEVREIMAELGYRTFNELIGQSQMPRQGAGDRPLEGARPRLREAVPQDRDAGQRRHLQLRAAEPRPRQGARQQADRSRQAGAGEERAGQARARHHQPRPRDRGHAVGRDCQALRPRRTAGGHHLAVLQGHGRAELRRLARAWRHARSRRRGQRLRRQGPLRRQADRAARSQLRHRAGGKHHRRQHGALRCHYRRVLLPRHRRRAFRGEKLGGSRRRRGHRRPRLRIHDRRRGRGNRSDWAQLRRRHVGRYRLRAGRGRHLRAALQPLHDRPGAGRGRGGGDAQALQPGRRSGEPRPRRRHARHDEPGRRAPPPADCSPRPLHEFG